jgi:hypothetical protein
MNAYIAIAIVGFGSIGLFALFLRSILNAGSSLPHDRSWLDEFSIDKYRPMLRLLSERDFEYLAMQSGFTPDIARRLRIERRKIFRAYLRNLVKDFNRLQAAGRELVAQSSVDRSELASALVRYQVTFYTGVLAVHCRLALQVLGIGSVDVRDLLKSLDNFRAEVAMYSAAPDFA